LTFLPHELRTFVAQHIANAKKIQLCSGAKPCKRLS